MNKYIISFDLVVIGQNYEPFYSELIRLGGTRVLLSQWLVKSDYSALELRDHLWQYMDQNDRLLVQVIDENWAAFNLPKDFNDL